MKQITSRMVIVALVLSLCLNSFCMMGAATDTISSFEGNSIAYERALDAYFNLFDTFDVAGETYIYPENYGGCFINENDGLSIYVVNPTDSACVDYYERCGTDQIEILDAEYALDELIEAYDYCINNVVNDSNNMAVVHQDENRVELIVDKNAVSVASVSPDNAKIDDVTKTYPCVYLTYDEVIQEDCSTTVKGGEELRLSNGEKFSAGYWAAYNNGGGYCLVTCGHPFYNSSSAVNVYDGVVSDANKFGVVNTSNVRINTYMDAALITRYNASETPTQSTLSNGVTVAGTRSQLPTDGYVYVSFRGTGDRVTIGSELSSYTSEASGITMSLYWLNIDYDDSGESGAPVYYYYGGNCYLFGLVVGRCNGGTVVCRASTINSYFGISAYTG